MNKMRRILLGLITAINILGLNMAAEALIIRDQCNQTSGDGQGHSCPGPNDLLIRPKYADGTCGDWMCCPPNADGQTYDCAHATNPTSSAISGVLKNLLGPRTTLSQGTVPTTKNPSMFQQQTAPVFRRGVEGGEDQPGTDQAQPDESAIQERAIPRQRLGVAELNCYCDGGNGTCSVTSTDGKTSTCSKGANDTCTGTCRYPKGTVSGFSGGMMRQ